ncbi:hypothetical protein [Anaerosporobacter faecicola]|uniref:hypothetical protein n=1 Tax=Anaerosporobacter faecicola TaxID=2718714 RepID=UPI00143C4BBF|nr:hypothetical protein [Anaerosporobacter faecicola]
MVVVVVPVTVSDVLLAVDAIEILGVVLVAILTAMTLVVVEEVATMNSGMAVADLLVLIGVGVAIGMAAQDAIAIINHFFV